MRCNYQKNSVFFLLCLLLVVLSLSLAATAPRTTGALALTEERAALTGRTQGVVVAHTEQLAPCVQGASPLCSRLANAQQRAAVPAQLNEGFEGQWPSEGWLFVDQSGSDNGEFLWGKRDCHPQTGAFAAWGGGGGVDGSGLNCEAAYPNNASTWAIYGPFDLSKATEADLKFAFWGESDSADPCGMGDRLFVGSSINGGEFSGSAICGDWRNGPEANGYNRGFLDLTLRLGEPTVWIAFALITDGSGAKQGFMIDDVVLDTDGTACQTPSVPTLLTPAHNSTTTDPTPTFDWSAVAGATAYDFALSDQANFDTTVITAAPDTPPFTPASALAAGTYFWRVRARSTAGGCDTVSAWSDVFNLTITQEVVPPAPPTFMEIDNLDDNGNYLLSWSAVNGATSYTLEEQLDGGSWASIHQGAETNLEITARADGQWCYRVNASSTAGTSNWSNVVCTVVVSTAALTADFGGTPQSGTSPLEVTFRNLATGDFSTCLWDYGDGQTSSTCAEYHNYTYDRVGLYSVTLTVSGPQGSSTTTRTDYIAVSRRCHTLSVSHIGGGNDPSLVPLASTGCPPGEFVPGALISLLAVPDEGWQLGWWSGTDNDASRSTTNRLTMPDQDHAITVLYELSCYRLERAYQGQGAAPVATPERSTTCPSEHYYAGEIIELSAEPAEGWRVFGWEGADSNNNERRNSITMPALEHTITVFYEPDVAVPPLYRLYLPLATTPTAYFAGSWEVEPNNGAGEANGSLYLNQDYFGYPNDQEDFFRFNLPTAATLLIELMNHTGTDPQLQLYDGSVDISRLVGSSTAFPYRIQLTAEPGIYFIRIVSVGNYNEATPYILRILNTHR